MRILFHQIRVGLGSVLAAAALNALDALGEKADPIRPELETLPRRDPAVSERMSFYVDRLLGALLNSEHGGA